MVPHALPSVYHDKKMHVVAQEWNSRREETTHCLEQAARKMKRWADVRRSPSHFKGRDNVLFKVLPTQFRSQRKL